MMVAGVDVWKSKWVAVVLNRGRYEGTLVAQNFTSMLQEFAGVSVIGVDMPIGLTRGKEVRHADTAARSFVGASRGRSVFRVYPREVYLAGDYSAACIQSMKVTGKSISRQAYAIGDRLLEVDAATTGRSDVFEAHPEVSFRAMAAADLNWSKSSWNGTHERIDLLAEPGIVLPTLIVPGGEVTPADLLDAAAVAWTADRIGTRRALSLPEPPQAAHGRQIAIWY
jgi:predicted RNase H-like nuclease